MDKYHVVMYHYTRDIENSRYPKIKGLDTKLFEKQLQFFKENFNVITMEQLLSAYRSNNPELPENSLLLTFDDGYIDNFTIAYPLLKKYGFQGSFFIPGKTFSENKVLDVNKVHFILASEDISKIKSELLEQMNYFRGNEFDFPGNEELLNYYAIGNRFDSADTIFVKRMLQTVLPETIRNKISDLLFEKFVGIEEEKFARELYMRDFQIYQMKKDGMFIGLHGYDHYWLADLSQKKMEADISKALDVMNCFIDSKEWVLNYPYGNCNDDVIKYIKENGCALAMCTDVHSANLKTDNRYKIPRLDCNDFPPKSYKYIEIS